MDVGRAAMVSDSHLFSTSRQMNRTVRKKKKESHLKIVFPPIMYACAAFSPSARQRAHIKGVLLPGT